MITNDFTNPEREALLDLATLAMYADGHLAGTEDARVLRLLETLGFTTDYDRGRQYDAAVTRVTKYSSTPESARSYAQGLAQVFSNHEKRRVVQSILDDIVVSDRHVSLQESGFLSLVREALEG